MARYLFLVVVSLLAAARPAPAKERTAGCPGFPRAFLRIENAIRLGAPVWNAGNQLATYAIYRDTTQKLLAELLPDASCGALQTTLGDALASARKARTPGSAGWDLRHGFDAVLEYVARGDSPKLRPPHPVDQTSAPPYDRDCPQLFTLVGRAERALEQGRAEAEARAMADELRREGRCPRVAEALANAVKKKAGAAALDRLAAGQAPPSEPDAPPAILDRCTLLPSLVEELTFAVIRGAPRYDDRRPDLCLGIYRKTAEEVVARYSAAGRCEEATRVLRRGLAEAQREGDPARAAWALRHAFDAIGEAFARAIPQ
jgi:hypothetical protein